MSAVVLRVHKGFRPSGTPGVQRTALCVVRNYGAIGAMATHTNKQKALSCGPVFGALTAQHHVSYCQRSIFCRTRVRLSPPSIPNRCRTERFTVPHRCAANYTEYYYYNSNGSAIITTIVLSYCLGRLLVTYPSDHRALRPRARRADVQVVSTGLCQSRRLRRG